MVCIVEGVSVLTLQISSMELHGQRFIEDEDATNVPSRRLSSQEKYTLFPIEIPVEHIKFSFQVAH